MPYTNIYPELNDGIITKSASSFNGARESSTGIVTDNLTTSTKAYSEASFNASKMTITRAFFLFDTSSITAASSIMGLTLNMGGYTGDNYGNFIVVRSTAFGLDGASGSTIGQDLLTSDFKRIHGWNGSAAMGGQATVYSSTPPAYGGPSSSTWTTTSTFNVIPLNSAFETIVKANDYVAIALVNYKYDYEKVTPTLPQGQLGNAWTYSVGGHHRDAPLSKRPYLSIFTVATGYDNAINGVASADIGKVNTVATADIAKIITVD